MCKIQATEIHKVNLLNLTDQKVMGKMRLSSVHLEIIPSSEGEAETVKELAPAANHVQQPWNVYSQAYMKAARDSIATHIRGLKSSERLRLSWDNVEKIGK